MEFSVYTHPRMTFFIGSLEDVLIFLAFFPTAVAFVGGGLTSRLKEKEVALSLRERRMAFLYGFTSAISRVHQEEHLTPTEWSILEILVRNAGKIMTRNQIVRSVWGPAMSEERHFCQGGY